MRWIAAWFAAVMISLGLYYAAYLVIVWIAL